MSAVPEAMQQKADISTMPEASLIWSMRSSRAAKGALLRPFGRTRCPPSAHRAGTAGGDRSSRRGSGTPLRSPGEEVGPTRTQAKIRLNPKIWSPPTRGREETAQFHRGLAFFRAPLGAEAS